MLVVTAAISWPPMILPWASCRHEQACDGKCETIHHCIPAPPPVVDNEPTTILAAEALTTDVVVSVLRVAIVVVMLFF